MPRTPSTPLPLGGCHVISLRPVDGHAPMRRAAAQYGAKVIALSPWKLATRHDARTELRAALQASHVVVTSPAAVRAANELQALRTRRGQRWFAVGAGTASALHCAGIAQVEAPTRMDSEGLLALAGLREVRGLDVALLTAPGGRGVIAATLRKRGARVLRADVYQRLPVAPDARALARLRALDAPAWLALSSGEALQRTLDAVPADLSAKLRRAHVVAASARLADLARAHGFRRIVVADDARPASLLAAAARHAGRPIR